MSPTARTLAAMRSDGWDAEVVERWNHVTRTRKDLYGCLDIVGIRPGETIGVQSTSASNITARVKKIQAEPRAAKWLAAGNRLQVHGWRKRAKPVDRKWWTATVVELVVKRGKVVAVK